jgi:transcriptional regulator with XRE-family HTH domain
MNENENKRNEETKKYKYAVFGERMNEMMFRRNISNKELANRMYVSVSTISGYRTGRRSPAVNDLATIATELESSADYLLGLKEQP